jgi:CIC family chloride channel protein
VAAGSAAGLAAAFHAPLAGALFVMEEMNPRFRTPVFSYIAVLLACVTAIIGLDLVYAKPALELEIHPAVPHASLWIFVVTGIVLGGFGYLFNRALVASLDGFAKLSAAWNRWIPLMVGGLVGLLAWLFPATDGRNEQLYHPMVGGGEETIIWSLNDHEATPLLIALAAMRFGLTMLCYGSGAPGGIFAPMLSISALVSQTLARLFHSLVPTVLPDPGALVIVGMGALVAATVGAPLTAIVLSLEITRNFNLGIPMITTAITATLVAKLLGGGAIYTTLLRRMVGR